MASHFKPPYVPTYKGAIDWLNGKESKRVSANCILHKEFTEQHGNYAALRLHNTDIVMYLENDDIIINTGGYWTNTTQRYINGAAPCNVSRKNGELYLNGVIWNGQPRNVAINSADLPF